MTIKDFSIGDIVVITERKCMIKRLKEYKFYDSCEGNYPLFCVGEVLGGCSLQFFDFLNRYYASLLEFRLATDREKFLYKLYGPFVSSGR